MSKLNEWKIVGTMERKACEIATTDDDDDDDDDDDNVEDDVEPRCCWWCFRDRYRYRYRHRHSHASRYRYRFRFRQCLSLGYYLAHNGTIKGRSLRLPGNSISHIPQYILYVHTYIGIWYQSASVVGLHCENVVRKLRLSIESIKFLKWVNASGYWIAFK